jgi:hypothetical protein
VKLVVGILCMVPLVGLVLGVVYMMSHPEVDALLSLDPARMKQVPRGITIHFAVRMIGTAFAQIGLAGVVGVHMEKRADASLAQKIAWPIAVGFVGSIAAPIWYFRWYLRQSSAQ